MNKRILVILLILAVSVGLFQPVPVLAAAEAMADIFSPNEHYFTLSESSRIFVVCDARPDGELLQTVQLVQRQLVADNRPSGEILPIVWGGEEWIGDGDIVVRLDSGCGLVPDGYMLDVTTTAGVTASHVDGLLYGLNALHKILRTEDSNTIQGFHSRNEPDTRQRAVSLDCGRKYFTKDWICNFIREMSWMGYNTLELHFSDDSGFRADFWDPAYYTEEYQPVNDFTWLCGSNYTAWTLDSCKNDLDRGKYLTTGELVEILQTAKEYHIDVIPAFDSPSHLDYTTWMYEQNYRNNPDYGFQSTYFGKTYHASDVNGCINYTKSGGWTTDLRWPYYSAVNIADEQAKAFIFELYIDIANFFKVYSGSKDFSIGADEVNLSTSNLASGYSFAWEFPYFVDYINELNSLLNGMGYTMRMYNDFMGSTRYHAADYDFDSNIEIMYWDSPYNPSTGEFAGHTQPPSYYVSQGRTVYNCIQTGTYYVLRLTGKGSDARSAQNRQWTFYHANEEDIYEEWYPADISEKGDYAEDNPDIPQENLGGAYFLIWCDYAGVNTETEIWNGVSDGKTGEFYSLRNRMWSNSTKMWDWDVSNSVSFMRFERLRDCYGDFPGFVDCSVVTELPEGEEPAACDESVYEDTLPVFTQPEVTDSTESQTESTEPQQQDPQGNKPVSLFWFLPAFVLLAVGIWILKKYA